MYNFARVHILRSLMLMNAHSQQAKNTLQRYMHAHTHIWICIHPINTHSQAQALINAQRAHNYPYINTHTYTNTHKHTSASMRISARMYSYTLALTHTFVLTHKHALKHARAQTHTLTCNKEYIHKRTLHTYMCTQAHTNIYTRP